MAQVYNVLTSDSGFKLIKVKDQTHDLEEEKVSTYHEVVGECEDQGKDEAWGCQPQGRTPPSVGKKYIVFIVQILKF